MKKFIFSITLALLFVCVFAVSASSATLTDTVDLIMKDGVSLSVSPDEILNYTDTDGVVTAESLKSSFSKDGYTLSSIQQLTFPAGITAISTTLDNTNDAGAAVTISVYDFSKTTTLTVPAKAMTSNSNLKKIILGEQTTLGEYPFQYSNNLTTIEIPDGKTVVIGANNLRSDMNSLSEIKIGAGANVTFNDTYIFSSNNSLAKRLVIADGASVVFGAESFKSAKALSISFGVGTYDFGTEAFQESALKSVYIPEGSSVTFSGTSVFRSCTSLQTVFIPSGVTELRGSTFQGCTALTDVYLMSVTKINDYAFQGGTKDLNVYMHSAEAFTAGLSAFDGRTGKITIYTRSSTTTFANSQKYTYTIYSGIPHYQYEHTEPETCLADGYVGYKTDCPCGVVYYDISYNEVTSSTTTQHSIGSRVVINEFDGHNHEISITYPDGFSQSGLKNSTCSRCGDKIIDNEPTVAIITTIGYSVKEDTTNSYGISSGFKIDYEALEEYEEANKVTINVGLIILNPESASSATTFFTNGTLSVKTNALQVEVTSNKYATINVMINGINENLLDLDLVIASYLTEISGETTKSYKTSFIQNAPVSTDEAYTFKKDDATLYSVSCNLLNK